MLGLGAILGGIGKLAGVFGGGAKASEDSRMNQAQMQLLQDRAKTDQYGIGQNAQFQLANTDLARKAFEENARGGRAKQAALGALLGNLQDVNINVPGIQTASVTGGLRPSALGEGGRAAGQLLNKQALEKMLMGDTYQGGSILQAPGVREIPKASGWEKLAGTLGTIGSIAGGVGAAFFPQAGGAPTAAGVPMGGGGASASSPLTDILAQIKEWTQPSVGTKVGS